MKKLLAIFGLIALAAASARADDVYTIVVKKQEKKALSKWTLAEWLETKDRMRMMDMWLAMHTPTPYEFFFGGDYQLATRAPGGVDNAWRLMGAAYATIFGLEGQYESSSQQSRWLALFKLRIFGYHYQGTNLTLDGGLHSVTAGGVTRRNPTFGVGMTFYFSRHFGFDGLYRHYFASEADASGVSYSGNRYEGGVFIDFSFVRVFGSLFFEKQNADSYRGTILGTKLFF